MSPFDRLPDELLIQILASFRSPASPFFSRWFFTCATVSRRWKRLANALLYQGVVKIASKEDCAALRRLRDSGGENVPRLEKLVVVGSGHSEAYRTRLGADDLAGVLEWIGPVDSIEVRLEVDEQGALSLGSFSGVPGRRVRFCFVEVKTDACRIGLSRLYLWSDIQWGILWSPPSWTFASLVVLVINSSALRVDVFTSSKFPSLKAAYFASIEATGWHRDLLGFDRSLLERLDTLQLLYSPEIEESRLSEYTALQIEYPTQYALDVDISLDQGDDLVSREQAAPTSYPGIKHLRPSMFDRLKILQHSKPKGCELARYPNLASISIPSYLRDTISPQNWQRVQDVVRTCERRGIEVLWNSVGDRSDLDYEFWEWVKEEKARASAGRARM
jgi:hypothetical protein